MIEFVAASSSIPGAGLRHSHARAQLRAPIPSGWWRQSWKPSARSPRRRAAERHAPGRSRARQRRPCPSRQPADWRRRRAGIRRRAAAGGRRRRPGSELDVRGSSGDSGARPRIRNELVDDAVAVEEARPSAALTAPASHRLPVPLPDRQLRMGHERVPDDGLERLDERRRRSAGGCDEHGRRRRAPPSVPPGTADDTVDRGADPPRELDRVHEVHRDVVLTRAAADGEDEERVVRAELGHLSQSLYDVSQPSSLVRAVSSETLSVGV